MTVTKSGISTILCFLFMKETYAPVLLAAKARCLHGASGNIGNGTKPAKPMTVLLRASARPTKMLIRSPILFRLSLFNAVVFGLIYLLLTTFPSVWRTQYGSGIGISGLCYLGLGIGMLLATAAFSVLSDRLLEAKRKNGESQPEERLLLMIWSASFLPIGLFWYGWAAEANTHWIVPILGTSLIGFGSCFIAVSICHLSSLLLCMYLGTDNRLDAFSTLPH